MTVLWNSCVLCLLFYLILINLDQNKSEDNKEWIDPDVKLCNELTIDAAVRSDDGLDYVFKDDYYWRVNSETGLSEDFGELITDKWPKLKTPIDAAFTVVDIHGQFTTAFITNNTWFLYLKHYLIDQGFTKDWVNFTNYPIEAAFTYFDSPVDRKYHLDPVYFLFNSSHYSKYNVRYLKNMSEVNITSKMYINLQFLFFLENDFPEETTLDEHVPNITAVLSNKNHLVFFGSGKYCRANITTIAPACRDYELAPFLKCPRTPRPTTITPSTIATEATTNASTKQTETVTTKLVTTYSTTITSLSTTVSTETLRHEFAQEIESSHQIKSSDDDSDDSDTYFWIIIILVMVVIIIIGLFIILAVKTGLKTGFKSEPEID